MPVEPRIWERYDVQKHILSEIMTIVLPRGKCIIKLFLDLKWLLLLEEVTLG